jgi:hypothetical protein
MAKLILVSAGSKREHDVMSLQHVRVDADKFVSVEIPYYTEEDGGVRGTYLRLEQSEALSLAARLTNAVAGSIPRSITTDEAFRMLAEK